MKNTGMLGFVGKNWGSRECGRKREKEGADERSPERCGAAYRSGGGGSGRPARVGTAKRKE
jgi:hypothetical protein